MPLYPAVDPKPSDFPAQPSLESLPDERPAGGLAPWRKGIPINEDPALVGPGAQPDFERDAPPIVFGGGVFGNGMYNSSQTLESNIPLRTVRLALRYGINAFDTSPYYFPSEFRLGNMLRRLEPEFPRSSYFLITKCGRYGPDKEHFDYSAAKVTSSIKASCSRLGTDYLDIGLMHDVEFVAEQVGRSNHDGWESGIIPGLIEPKDGTKVDETLASLGLAPTLEAASKIHGPGDEKILEAVRALFALKDQGIIRRVGVSGYPLPVLLRISRLVATNAPYRPLDVVLNYSNHCLHSDVLVGWRELFAADPDPNRGSGSTGAWKAPVLLNGSPFSMGLVTDGNPPNWHPASAELKQACRDASANLVARGESLATTALRYGLRGSELANKDGRPQLRSLVGLSTPDHVHSVIEAFRVLCASGNDQLLHKLDDEEHAKRKDAYQQQVNNEQEARELFKQRNVREWSWSSGL